MRCVSVQIAERSHQALQDLAQQTGEAEQEVLAKAIELYRRQQFLRDANESYAALRRDPAAWQEELEERAAWDTTLPDGLS